jgi:hypothetical protein
MMTYNVMVRYVVIFLGPTTNDAARTRRLRAIRPNKPEPGHRKQRTVPSPTPQ